MSDFQPTEMCENKRVLVTEFVVTCYSGKWKLI